MGQTRSGLSSGSTAAPDRAKWKADETASRLHIRSLRIKEKPRREQLNKSPMKNKVLSCLGRRKRSSSHTEEDLGRGTAAADPATTRGHRVGKLPRDEAVSVAGGHREDRGCLETPSGECAEATQHAVNIELAAGASDASRLETRSGEVSSAGGDQPEPAEKNNASDPPARAMEDQPLGGHRQDRIVSEVSLLTGTNLSSAPLLPPDPDSERTLSSLHPDKRGGLSIADDHTDAKMTKTDCTTIACSPESTGDPKTRCPTETDVRKDSDDIQQGRPGGQSFPGTIPKLIITRDPSPSRPLEPPALLSAPAEPSTASCLELHPDEESPCSDSGCGGSPALIRCSRKLSNSSSIGLSSASSFEESEDDFASSDIESSLSQCQSSPDDGTGVGLYQNNNIQPLHFTLLQTYRNNWLLSFNSPH